MGHSDGLPVLQVARATRESVSLDDDGVWDPLERITPLWLADGSGPARQPTVVRVCYDDAALYVRFDCADEDIWGTLTRRDDPIYEQEVAEIFIGAGADDPVDYFEFQVSPDGVLFDARIHNPTSTRRDLRWDSSWDCPGIVWMARRDDANARWFAALAIPWEGITPDGAVPTICRANLYRIERPRNGETEYSCWSPTLTEPADFHKPARFGTLTFGKGQET
ncbi:MAG: carbohydrate-binding family 9-like protein [Anaerolineae bacterium]|nr:carbohydrate-binding family 9-like protein [Anaerolineae bacterium]